MKHAAGLLMFALAASGCGEGHAAAMEAARADSLARARQDSVNRAQPGYIVDSILPVEEQLRRFRKGLEEAPREFVGGAESPGALVRQFVRSLESADTAALLRLTISRAEFAYLVYPDSPFSAPPWTQSPDIVWMRHVAASGTGLKRLLNRLGGTTLGFRSWSCGSPPAIEGANRLWKNCEIRFEPTSQPERSLPLFGGMIERHGRFKILSYANAF